MPIKIIIDTNLLISFLISNTFNKLDSLISQNKIKFIISAELINEFVEVASRPKLKKAFTETELILLLTKILNHAEYISIKTQVTICRDENDNYLLALAIDAKADYLITGDKDLLTLKTFKKTKILTLSEFINTFLR